MKCLTNDQLKIHITCTRSLPGVVDGSGMTIKTNGSYKDTIFLSISHVDKMQV